MNKQQQSATFQALAHILGTCMAVDFRGLLTFLEENPPREALAEDTERAKKALSAVLELDGKLREIYPQAFANAEHNKQVAAANQQRKAGMKNGRHVH